MHMFRSFVSRLLGKPGPAAPPPPSSPTAHTARSKPRPKPKAVPARPHQERAQAPNAEQARPQRERAQAPNAEQERPRQERTQAPNAEQERPRQERTQAPNAEQAQAPDAPAERSRRRRGGRGRNGRGGDAPQRAGADAVLGPAPRDRRFGRIAVSAPVARALDEMGYAEPTPIQELVVGPLLNGADIVGQAQTGTGKTAGFGIPIAEAVDAREPHVQAIVLTPTRELTRQVADEIGRLCAHRGAVVVPVYGGARLGPQMRALEDGAQIVVGTPGRVIDLIDRGVLRLARARTVVLDEADQMLDIGFLPAVRRILRSTPRTRQTALFTATVPTMIKRLIYSYLREPEWFRVGEESEPVEQVVQRYCEVASRDKLAALLEVLDPGEQTLVFRRTQGDVDWLVRALGRRKVAAAAIHGGLPQGERNAVMQAFRDGALKLLVSTNLTSRGIDVPAVANVINYDIPETVEEYVHRIGRTARMGREGVAITFVSEWDIEYFDAIAAHVGQGLGPLDLSLYRPAAAAGA